MNNYLVKKPLSLIKDSYKWKRNKIIKYYKQAKALRKKRIVIPTAFWKHFTGPGGFEKCFYYKNKLVDYKKDRLRDHEGPKLEAIKEELSEVEFSKEYISGIGFIVNKQESPRVIVVSHMDLIPTFNRGFREGNTFEEQEDVIVGALDNTLTNAFLIKLIKETYNIGIKDIEFVFSEGEERGMIGMRNYMEEFSSKKDTSFFINLDVTNDGWGSYCSVEYDVPDSNGLKEAIEALDDISEEDPHFQFFRFCDDMDAILSGGGHGFSYCIPTKNIIHSYENTTETKSIEPYYKGLKALSKKMDYKNIGKGDIDISDLAKKYPYLKEKVK